MPHKLRSPPTLESDYPPSNNIREIIYGLAPPLPMPTHNNEYIITEQTNTKSIYDVQISYIKTGALGLWTYQCVYRELCAEFPLLFIHLSQINTSQTVPILI